MSYDPNALPSAWQRPQSTVSRAVPYAPRIDSVRLARLMILMALAVFWVLVFMALF